MADRQSQYKNNAKTADSLRQGRHNRLVSIRKDKRDELIEARRSLGSVCNIAGDEVVAVLNDLRNGDVELRRQALLRMDAIVETDDPFVKDLLTADVMSIIGAMMQDEIHDSTLMILAKISATNADCAKAVCQADLFPKIAEATRSNDEKLSATCVRSVGYMTQICFPWNLEAKTNAMRLLARLLDGEPSYEMVESLAESFLCLCRRDRNEPTLPDDVALDLLKALYIIIANVTRHANPKSRGLIDTLLAMTYISEQEASKAKLIIDLGFVRIFASSFSSDDRIIRLYTLRLIADICDAGCDEVETFLAIDVLRFARAAMCVEHNAEDRLAGRTNFEIARLVANVVKGTNSQVQRVVEADLFVALKQLLQLGNYDVNEMVVLAFRSASRLENTAQLLLQLDAIPPLCEVLITCDSEIASDIIITFLNLLHFAKDEQQSIDILYMLERYAMESIEHCMCAVDGYLVQKAEELYDRMLAADTEWDFCAIDEDDVGEFAF